MLIHDLCMNEILAKSKNEVLSKKKFAETGQRCLLSLTKALKTKPAKDPLLRLLNLSKRPASDLELIFRMLEAYSCDDLDKDTGCQPATQSKPVTFAGTTN